MKYLMPALATIGFLALVIFVLTIVSDAHIQVHEDGSYTASADIPFSQAWRD
jgi:hypothetical protein